MFKISDQSPSEGEKNVSLDSLIEFAIKDDGTQIETSSLIVEINGIRAIDGSSFVNGFAGSSSAITSTSSGLSIAIDPETDLKVGKVYLVKIQVQNKKQKFYNFDYAFKTTPKEPVLISASPADGDTLTSSQILFLEFKDNVDDVNVSTIDVYLNGLLIVSSGVFQAGFDSSLSEIKKTTNGAIVRIDPSDQLQNGSYNLIYYIDDTSGNTLRGDLSFQINLPEIALPDNFPQVSFVGFASGVRKVTNIGRGDALNIEWYKPLSRIYKADVFALIYQNESRLEIFDTDPKYIAPASTVFTAIDGLTPGLTLAFAVRGMEAHKGALDLSGMTEVGDVYKIPDPATISSTVGPSSTSIVVESTSGYPSSGVLILNGIEVVKYVSKTSTTFNISTTSNRGLNDTTASTFVSGDSLKMFLECQDKNTVIVVATPTYVDGYASGREISGTGLVVNNYTDSDKKFFQGYDFCGYHTPLPQEVLQGKNDCGSYIGGEFNHYRGMNLFDRMISREEVLLDQVGEPVILLKRIWDGATCSCSDSRRMHPKVKSCKKCYGTGYAGGYEQFLNVRRADSRLMMMFGDTTEDLKLDSKSHLEQVYEPQCWTLPSPAIKDRDLIVRYDFNDDVEFIYEVLDVTRDKLFYRHYTRQKLKLKRLDKTDIVYTIKYSFDK
mgnify:CR=1 FL=1